MRCLVASIDWPLILVAAIRWPEQELRCKESGSLSYLSPLGTGHFVSSSYRFVQETGKNKVNIEDGFQVSMYKLSAKHGIPTISPTRL